MEDFIWVEKYRPHTVVDCILPSSLKEKFLAMVEQKNIPNLLMIGGPGTGKTTVAKAMLDELDCDYLFLNGSLKGDINTLRTDISQFASTGSFKKKRKYVILDEADGLTVATQPALRNFMEEYSANCGFILTANHKNKIIKELQSRCAIIDFNFQKSDAPVVANEFYRRLLCILQDEKIKFDNKLVAQVVHKYYPDFRRVLNEIQSNSPTGELSTDVLSGRNVNLAEVVEYMKVKNFVKIREWAASHSTNVEDVFRAFYEKSDQLFPLVFAAELILIIGRYQYQQAFVADTEINLAAFLIEVTAEATWK